MSPPRCLCLFLAPGRSLPSHKPTENCEIVLQPRPARRAGVLMRTATEKTHRGGRQTVRPAFHKQRCCFTFKHTNIAGNTGICQLPATTDHTSHKHRRHDRASGRTNTSRVQQKHTQDTAHITHSAHQVTVCKRVCCCSVVEYDSMLNPMLVRLREVTQTALALKEADKGPCLAC